MPPRVANVMLVGVVRPRASQPHASSVGWSVAAITAGDSALTNSVKCAAAFSLGHAYSRTTESGPGVSTNSGALPSTYSRKGPAMSPPKLSRLYTWMATRFSAPKRISSPGSSWIGGGFRSPFPRGLPLTKILAQFCAWPVESRIFLPSHAAGTSTALRYQANPL